MSHQRKILLGVFALLAAALIYSVFHKNPYKQSLELYRKQLAAQGEKLTLAEIVPHVTPAEEKAAQDLTNALALLGSGLKDYPSTMKPAAPGRAVVAWAEESMPGYSVNNTWPATIQQIMDHQANLARIRNATKPSAIRFNLHFTQGFALLLPHLAKLKQAEIWFSMATLVELHQGHPTNAFEDLKTCLALIRPLENEPVEISQLVRMAQAQIALGATWEFLQYPGLPDEQLAELQTQWSSTSFSSNLTSTLEMERATSPAAYDWARSSYSNFCGIGLGTPPTSFGDLLVHPSDNFGPFIDSAKQFPRYWSWKRHWSYVEQLYNLKSAQATLECAREVKTSGVFFPASKKLTDSLTAINSSSTDASNHFAFNSDAWMFWDGNLSLAKIGDMEMERRLVVVAIALKRFQIRHGKYPPNLKDLVPDFVREVPLDFIDGKPLRYHPNADGTFLLYSVGEDGEDNGGDTTLKQSLKNTPLPWWRGRDAVWPMPASREQVLAYKKRAIAEIIKSEPISTSETNLPPDKNKN